MGFSLGGAISGALSGVAATGGNPIGGIAGAFLGGISGGAQESALSAGTAAGTEALNYVTTQNQPYTAAGANATDRLQAILGLTPYVPPGSALASAGSGTAPSGIYTTGSSIGTSAVGNIATLEAGTTYKRGQYKAGQVVAKKDSTGGITFMRAGANGLLKHIAPDDTSFDINQARRDYAKQSAPAEQAPTPAARPSQTVAGSPPALPGTSGAKGPSPTDILESTPGYQFTVAQSEKAIQRAAAAGGFRNSGRLYTELVQNAAGLASQNYENYVANLLNVAKLGQDSASLQAKAAFAGADIKTAGAVGKANLIDSYAGRITKAAPTILEGAKKWFSGGNEYAGHPTIPLPG